MIEKTSYLWHRLFVENRIPADGVVIEVAPGYEPKIGNALALLDFRGTLYSIEPDKKAACHIQTIYKRILPHATVNTVIKPLQNVRAGVDLPFCVDALVASHPFDDMVMACVVDGKSFFSEEREGAESVSPLYAAIQDEDYARGVESTKKAWKNFIAELKPSCFIASQYPSRMLTVKGLLQRQMSGYTVLEQLKSLYGNFLVEEHHEDVFGFKGDPKWWIVAQKPYRKCRSQKHATTACS